MKERFSKIVNGLHRRKNKFSITDFFNKCDQSHADLAHLPKKAVMENFIYSPLIFVLGYYIIQTFTNFKTYESLENLQFWKEAKIKQNSSISKILALLLFSIKSSTLAGMEENIKSNRKLSK